LDITAGTMLTNSWLQSADKLLFTTRAGMLISDINVFDPEGSGSEPCIAVSCAGSCTQHCAALHTALCSTVHSNFHNAPCTAGRLHTHSTLSHQLTTEQQQAVKTKTERKHFSIHRSQVSERALLCGRLPRFARLSWSKQHADEDK